MAISNFIPTIWSENLHKKLEAKLTAVANCTREYEGDIKEKGSVVKIVGVGNIDINDYTKNTDMDNPQSLNDTVCELPIDQAKYFNFQIDDIEKAQASPKLMSAAMELAAQSLANEADKYIFTLYRQVPRFFTVTDPTCENVLDAFLSARIDLYQGGVGDDQEVVLEISPEVAAILLKAKVNLASDNSSALEAGSLGKLFGCTVFVNNNIVKVDTSNGGRDNVCVMRTKRAVAFASQISEIHAYRPEKRFADAVKGLYLYGATVVYPEEYISVAVNIM